MAPDTKTRFRSLFAGLFVVLMAAAFAAALIGFTSEQKKRAAQVPPLNSWSNEKLLGELGEATAVDVCDELLGGPGFTLRMYENEEQRRYEIVCTPAK